MLCRRFGETWSQTTFILRFCLNLVSAEANMAVCSRKRQDAPSCPQIVGQSDPLKASTCLSDGTSVLRLRRQTHLKLSSEEQVSFDALIIVSSCLFE